jgi:glycosyltransferase involved in cell wall biosynthesis
MKRLSIIVPTLNNGAVLDHFFKSLQSQTYPKKNLEVLVVDGGSTDSTLEKAKKYGARIVHNQYVLAEPAIHLGMSAAKGDLIMILATDNIYKEKDDLTKIVSVFDNPQIYGAFPKHDSSPQDSIFSKYHNRFTDPFNHFVYQDAANARTFHRLYKTTKHTELYDVYDYSSNPTRPMIAFAQGFTILNKYRRVESDSFDDIKPLLDLIDSGKQIAYVHSVSLYHHTIKNVSHFIRKQRWATQNAMENKNYGVRFRYQKLSQGQRFRMLIWPIYSLTIIGPCIRALAGLLIDREPLWLFHPLMCFLSGYASLTQIILYNKVTQKKVSRQ